jgi:hypothetical protein
MARFYLFCLVQDHLAKEELPGDIAEIGVYQGHTASLLAAAARRLHKNVFLFDTFEGFDRRDFVGVDANGQRHFSDTSLEAVRSLVGEDRVTYVKGYFPATAAAIPDDAAFCLVHIDCDLYKPARSALEFFYERLCPGGFMLVHDYYSLCWPGIERAVDEFLASRPESPIPVPDSAGTVAFRKVKRGGSEESWFHHRRATALRKGWAPAQGSAVGTLLGDGWHQPEVWGLWGMGQRHELTLFFPNPPTGDLLLEVDCHAVLIGPRTAMLVDVFVGNNHAAVWEFVRSANFGVRRVPIAAGVAARSVPELRVTFAPRSVASPHELDPASPDTRKLGLGVTRMRLVDAGPAQPSD